MQKQIYRLPFAVLVLVVLFSLDAAAQRLVSFNTNGVLTETVGNQQLDKHFKDVDLPRFDDDVTLYKIVYTSTDEFGRPINLNGLAAFPRSGAPKGLVVYMHGTQWNRKDSPSRFKLKRDDNAFFLELSAFATGGYAMVMPDYIGLGDNKRVHPYPLNLTNAQSGVDIIDATRTMAERLGYKLSDKLFVSGYSEGGGTAMGLTKLLEEKNDPRYRVERSAPMSGPYDLTGATRDYLLAEAKGADLIARAFLLGYCVTYFKKQYGVKADDYFSKPVAMAVNGAFIDGRKETDIVLRLAIIGTLSGSTRSVEKLLTKRFITALETLDTSDPVIRELSRNNVFDWRPRTEMLVQNLATDKIVAPENTHNAIAAMRRRGASAATLRHIEIKDESLDHGSVAKFTTINARKFFDGGFNAVRNAQ